MHFLAHPIGLTFANAFRYALPRRNTMREISKKLFTVDEYYRMAEAGILTEDDRVELIEGEIIQMSPIGYRHAICVTRTTTFLIRALEWKAVVTSQNPLLLTDWTAPQPDVTVLLPPFESYDTRLPKASDVLLVVEVSDNSLRYDCDIKVPLFAAAGCPEVWIEDLQNDLILVYRDPSDGAYKTTLTFHRGDSISPVAFPDKTLAVDDLLGTVPS
jgi:Uma2 family endonuclease